MNKVTLMGRLTKDPDVRYAQNENSTCVARYSLAVDRRGKEKEADFINCVAWRGTAEFVQRFFHKGSMIIMEGRLQMRTWTDKDGGKHEQAEILAEHVYFGD